MRYLFIFLVLLVFGCGNSGNLEKSNKLIVVTTTGMIYDAVINIGKDSVEATALMGPGVDPHLYKATQGDLVKLNEADLILYNGLHLEGKMGEVFEKLSRIKQVVPVAEVVPKEKLRKDASFQNAIDPHIWFDITLWKYAVREVSNQLIKNDPESADYYRKNTTQYLTALDSLHLKVKEQIASIPSDQRILITSHDAFGYFGDAYDIEVSALQGISTVSDFGLKDVTNLIDIITKRNVKAVFVETSVSEQAIKAVVDGAKEKGQDVKIGGSLYSDAMGNFGTPEGTYIGMMDSNVKTIVEALK